MQAKQELYKEQPFGILEEYTSLSPRYKAMLCEYMYSENQMAFRRAVQTVWPHATHYDVKKLQSFLTILKVSDEQRQKTIH